MRNLIQSRCLRKDRYLRNLRFSIPALLFGALLPACRAEQPYLGRFDVYTGFSDLKTPSLNGINQVGFHLQTGWNASRRISYGFDYSVQNGSTTLTAGISTAALRQQLAAELPRGYVLNLPIDATTQTFTAGGQLAIRHYRQATFFARPVLAAFRLKATPRPGDPVASLVAAQLAPGGSLTDWYGAYGAGGGVELPVQRHVGARIQFDAGWNHPFTNILGSGGWSYRFSVGPAFHFGRNVPTSKQKS